jgi:hypothetical protein
MPGGAGLTGSTGVGADYFMPPRPVTAEIGTQQPAPATGRAIRGGRIGEWFAIAQGKANMIANESDQAFTGSGRHGWHGPLHGQLFSRKRGKFKSQKWSYGASDGRTGCDRDWLPTTFKLAGKLLKNCVLSHVLGED